MRIPCKEWTGTKNSTGYGVKGVQCEDGKWRPRVVHRLAWIERFGPIPKGLDVMHLCDNPPCYEIHHLALGTRRANMLDCENKKGGYQARGKEHGLAKLDDDKVREIRSRIAAGATSKGLAREYNVGKTAIVDIKYRRTWKHV